MALTDLTNTKWLFNNDVDLSEFGVANVNVTFNINFDINNGEILYTGFEVRYKAEQQNGLRYVNTVNEWAYYSSSGWADNGFKTIKITGGTDVTNSDLIAGITANATQIINTDRYISSIKQNNQKYLIKDNEARTSITNIIDTSGHISVGEDDTLIWTVGNGPTPPTEYVIPAGTYYGKASPALPQTSVLINLEFTADDSLDYLYMGIRNTDIKYSMDGDIQWDNAYISGAWNDGNYNFRVIEVTNDTPVTQAEHNAFFACFDYVFYIDSAAVAYQPQTITWEEFIASSYNTEGFTYNSQGYVIYRNGYVSPNHQFSRYETLTDYIINGNEYASRGD